jgi:nitroreductase
MTRPWQNHRTPTVEVDALFLDRWSPRALAPEPLTRAEIAALFEAARWAPSCFNEQPWLFRYAVTAVDRERFAAALTARNRTWTATAPLLIFVLARRTFAHNNRDNRHASFDAGAAWMSLALQARRLGLFAHAMAGFDREAAAQILQVDLAQYDILAAVAVGRYGDPATLPDELRTLEGPNDRKPWTEVAIEG